MIPSGIEIFVALTPIDLRWGFERLAGLAQEQTGRAGRSGALFVFFGKRKTALKIVFADTSGLCLFYKRLAATHFACLRRPCQARRTSSSTSVNSTSYSMPELKAEREAAKKEREAASLRISNLEKERDNLRSSHERLRLELELFKRRLFIAKAERSDDEPLARPQAVHAPDGDSSGPQTRTEKETWAALMRATFDLDVLTCSRCGGRMRYIATILDARVARKILEHLGLPAPRTAGGRSEGPAAVLGPRRRPLGVAAARQRHSWFGPRRSGWPRAPRARRGLSFSATAAFRGRL